MKSRFNTKTQYPQYVYMPVQHNNSMGENNTNYTEDERFIGPFLVPFILGGIAGAAISPGGIGRPNYNCCPPVVYQQPVYYQQPQSYPQPYPMPYPVPYDVN